MKQCPRIAVILHNIRSAHNVGAILRTAEAAGVEAVYLTGYTPAPVDRFGIPRKDVAKAALGAERMVHWETRPTLAPLIKNLKRNGWTIVAVEQSDRGVPYDTFRTPDKTAFIFGNEVRGVSKTTLNQCDAVVEIPMHGRKESLNVSVAAGIILFSALR